MTTSLAELAELARTGPLDLAGNIISSEMFSQLDAASIPEPPNQRIVRLESDPKTSDAKIPGSALWLRAEPDDDPSLSAAIARDIAGWIDL